MALLDIDLAEVERLIGQQFKGKDQLIVANIQALHLGWSHAQEHLTGCCRLKVRRADRVGDRIFLDGNNAAALGCVYGGATVARGTRSRLDLAGGSVRPALPPVLDRSPGPARPCAIVQAEDELAAIGTVIGAAWNGRARSRRPRGPASP